MEATASKTQKLGNGHYKVGEFKIVASGQTDSEWNGGWDILRNGQLERGGHCAKKSEAVKVVGWWIEEEAEANRVPNCTVKGSHCEQCGGRDESSEFNQGYSSCCNELITDQLGCRDHHGAY